MITLQAKMKISVEWRWQNGIIYKEVGKSQQQIGLIKVNCRGKLPMHIIVWICSFGHAIHKITYYYGEFLRY